jgi:hypothetical protein
LNTITDEVKASRRESIGYGRFGVGFTPIKANKIGGGDDISDDGADSINSKSVGSDIITPKQAQHVLERPSSNMPGA